MPILFLYASMQSRKKCLTLTVAVMCLDRSSDRPLPTEITGEPDKAKKQSKYGNL